MPQPSRRARVIAAFADRLATIQADRDPRFGTNVGQALYVNELPVLGEDDPPAALALTIGTDAAKSQFKKCFIELPLNVQIQVHGRVPNAWQVLEAAIADVKVAVENVSDRTLGGLVEPDIVRGQTQTFPRTAGGEVFGATLPYIVTYEEAVGDPIGS